MPTTTALVAVNRVQRRGRIATTATVTDGSAPTLLDFVNEAAREVFETAEWEFLTRHDGELAVVPRTAYTGTFTATLNSTTVSNIAQNAYATYYGAFRSRLVLTEHATHGGTSFAIATATHPAADDVYTLETAFPGATTSGLNGFVYVVDYQLPATVRDILSVRHEENELKLEFVDKTFTFDSMEPAAHLVTDNQPQIIYVGGSVKATVTSGTATTALGIMVWPVATEKYVLSYSYRYLHPELSAAADVLDAPSVIVDLIVDKATAKAYRSAVFNDPEMAQQIELDVARRFQRLLGANNPAPQRRMILRSHDQATGASQFGSRPRDPRTFYTP
jgi:hypothetical protein